ncbi:hypothetical protein JS510_00640 [Mycoplasma tauri]|uniref:Mbov_0398 family ICE element protein n=1 Tax=Mycoplasma tauri TaxID=547987 RepID=UPI00196870E9|nr:hypothetical protein [Mycoplasma tauri]QSB07623.1 hypothetical protein JS510_00640 [Mycoplasma tauri]
MIEEKDIEDSIVLDENISILSEENILDDNLYVNDQKKAKKSPKKANKDKKTDNDLDNEAKLKTKAEKMNKYRIVSTRFTSDEDLMLFQRWESRIKSKGLSSYAEIQNIIRTHMVEEEKKGLLKEFKQDLFYVLRKAMWASLTPFLNSIKDEMRSQNNELTFIDLKLNLLINSLIKDKDKINSPDAKDLSESEYIKMLREKVANSDKSYQKRIMNKMKQDERSLKTL